MFILPGGVHLGPLWGHTVAFETENNATLWPWLQMKEKLGLVAQAAATALLILIQRGCAHPTLATFAVAAVVKTVIPLPSNGRSKASAPGTFIVCCLSNLYPPDGQRAEAQRDKANMGWAPG